MKRSAAIWNGLLGALGVLQPAELPNTERHVQVSDVQVQLLVDLRSQDVEELPEEINHFKKTGVDEQRYLADIQRRRLARWAQSSGVILLG